MFSFNDQLVVVECAQCHMNFGVTPGFQKDRLKDHTRFTCPAGHSNIYKGQSEEEKLRLENQRLIQRQAQKDDEIKAVNLWLRHEQASKIAYKGQATRLRNRAAAGVCPCCNRNFANMRRHIETKHPEFKKDKAV